jgi:hypothetical protein
MERLRPILFGDDSVSRESNIHFLRKTLNK